MKPSRKPLLFGVVSLVVAVFIFCALFWHHLRETGFSTRVEPTSMEAMMAGSLRDGAIPVRYEQMKNPVVSDDATLTEARSHYADHCAICHANNGDGQTMFGKGMYPRPPDLRATDTQQMSDGQIYWVIKNGVRLSGMPAFGDTGDEDVESWKLVSFIRHLPKLTPAEEAQMEALNPKSPDEYREEKDEEQFLNGRDSTAKTPTTDHMKGHEQ
ncbi:MAG: c-type cytochrome [Acidobacteriota bacterium]|nr:c-type cytochrome [Acidobacteriota bacterium]